MIWVENYPSGPKAGRILILIFSASIIMNVGCQDQIKHQHNKYRCILFKELEFVSPDMNREQYDPCIVLLNNCINIKNFLQNQIFIDINRTIDENEKSLLCHILVYKMDIYTPPTNYSFNWSVLFDTYHFNNKQIISIFKTFKQEIPLYSLFVTQPIKKNLIIRLYNLRLVDVRSINILLNKISTDGLRKNCVNTIHDYKSLSNDISTRNAQRYPCMIKNVYFKKNIVAMLQIINLLWGDEKFLMSDEIISYLIQYGLDYNINQRPIHGLSANNIVEKTYGVLEMISRIKKFIPETICQKTIMPVTKCYDIANHFSTLYDTV